MTPLVCTQTKLVSEFPALKAGIQGGKGHLGVVLPHLGCEIFRVRKWQRNRTGETALLTFSSLISKEKANKEDR